MEKKISKFIYWTPRILGIIFVLFLAMFSLDVFDQASSFSEIAIGLFIHNIPALILLIVLIISWKHELVGAIVFILAGILYIALILKNVLTDISNLYMLFWTLQISGPSFLIGILFWFNWHQKKKARVLLR